MEVDQAVAKPSRWENFQARGGGRQAGQEIATQRTRAHDIGRKEAEASLHPCHHAAFSAALIFADAELEASCNVAVDKWA